MFDSPKELLDKIRLGEDSFFECKEVRFAGNKISGPDRRGLADELAAFANGRGGVCLLGVEDRTRDIIGIPMAKLDKVEDLAREACIDSIDPPIAPIIERLWLPTTMGEEAAVIKIEVSPSLFVHKSPGGYLHRVGSAKREMSPDYLARLFQQRSQARIIRFDEQVVPNTTMDDLLPALWERFQTDRTRDARDDLLVKLGMARRDETGILRPTVTGILMAGKTPESRLPNAYIQAVAYRGTAAAPQSGTDPYQLDALDIRGPLDAQILEGCRFVARNMRVMATKAGGREDIPQFDPTAVFEAIVNAVAHRDYSLHGAKIRLRLFADRLEIFSPGSLPNTMTVDSLPYRQAARNEAITSLLAKCPAPPNGQTLRDGSIPTHRGAMMDKRGEGVRIILDNSEQLSGRRPEYRLIDETELLLIIYGTEHAIRDRG
uniref:Predicted transcriptional regulator, contains HTH domain n=1 Tax=Candidatus Kentrum sp. SD TaxID=2126332 RepID=A0A450YGH0_9GAMM|nr:MAG: Predicted transcriptional regulator, contains HTH domain [Candidatus Kentron sp. SD]VFK40627.1 MAG: Predicted transcriptional regulator, contains HTH domain [Candidatus Kentron sp. SD]